MSVSPPNAPLHQISVKNSTKNCLGSNQLRTFGLQFCLSVILKGLCTVCSKMFYKGWEFILLLFCSSLFCSKLMFLTCFPLFMPKRESLPSFFAHFIDLFLLKEWHEWFPPLAQKSNHEQITQITFLLTKISESLEKPMSDFPTMTKEWQERITLVAL